MGKCDVCGLDAGFLKKRHPQCEAERQARLRQARELELARSKGYDEMVASVAEVITEGFDDAALTKQLDEIAARTFNTDTDRKEILVRGWEHAVDLAMEDDILSAEEELALDELARARGLTQADLDTRGAFMRVVKAGTLRNILDGEIPERLRFDGELPFNLQKGERLVWVFPGTAYREQRTRTSYVGGSQGVSVRVMKGVYYRTSAFKGDPVQTTESIDLGTGLLGVTDKHLYFHGPDASFRVKYDKIVSFTPFSDGIGIQRDAQSAKPQSFQTGDGWFTYNLVTNLAKGLGG